MDCITAQNLMMKLMDGLLTVQDGHSLKQHVKECESCREYYLAYDELMEHAASPNMEWEAAPQGFTTQVVALAMPVQVNAEMLERRNLAILRVVWGLGAISFGAALYFIFYPHQLELLLGLSPLAATIADATHALLAWASNMSEFALANAGSAAGPASIISLLFVLAACLLLFVLQRDEEESAAAA